MTGIVIGSVLVLLAVGTGLVAFDGAGDIEAGPAPLERLVVGNDAVSAGKEQARRRPDAPTAGVVPAPLPVSASPIVSQVRPQIPHAVKTGRGPAKRRGPGFGGAQARTQGNLGGGAPVRKASEAGGGAAVGISPGRAKRGAGPPPGRAKNGAGAPPGRAGRRGGSPPARAEGGGAPRARAEGGGAPPARARRGGDARPGPARGRSDGNVSGRGSHGAVRHGRALGITRWKARVGKEPAGKARAGKAKAGKARAGKAQVGSGAGGGAASAP